MVTGTIIAVIGISLMRVGINWAFLAIRLAQPRHQWSILSTPKWLAGWLAGWLADAAAAAGSPGSAFPPIPKGVALALSVPNPKYADLVGVGIVIGGLVATAFGLMNFDKVGEAAWFEVAMLYRSQSYVL